MTPKEIVQHAINELDQNTHPEAKMIQMCLCVILGTSFLGIESLHTLSKTLAVIAADRLSRLQHREN